MQGEAEQEEQQVRDHTRGQACREHVFLLAGTVTVQVLGSSFTMHVLGCRAVNADSVAVQVRQFP